MWSSQQNGMYPHPCIYRRWQGRTRRCLQPQASGMSSKIQFRRKGGGCNRNRTSSVSPCLPQSYTSAVNCRNATLVQWIRRRKRGLRLGASGKALVWIPPGSEESHNITAAVTIKPWIPQQSNGLLCSANSGRTQAKGRCKKFDVHFWVTFGTLLAIFFSGWQPTQQAFLHPPLS